jgi:hypothetical protein
MVRIASYGLGSLESDCPYANRVHVKNAGFLIWPRILRVRIKWTIYTVYKVMGWIRSTPIITSTFIKTDTNLNEPQSDLTRRPAGVCSRCWGYDEHVNSIRTMSISVLCYSIFYFIVKNMLVAKSQFHINYCMSLIFKITRKTRRQDFKGYQQLILHCRAVIIRRATWRSKRTASAPKDLLMVIDLVYRRPTIVSTD